MMRLSTVASIASLAVLAGCGFFSPDDNSLGPNNTIKLNAADSAAAVQFLKSIGSWGGSFSSQIVVSDSGRVEVLYIYRWKGGNMPFPKEGMDSLKGIYLSGGCTAKSIRFTGLERFTSLTSAVFNCPDLAAWPEGLLDNKRWEWLFFESGHLPSLPDSITQLDSLSYIRIYDSDINSIPGGMLKLKKLTRAIFPGNKLCNVPDTVKTWLASFESGWYNSQRCP